MDGKQAIELLANALKALEEAGYRVAVLKDGEALPLSGKIGFGCCARPSLFKRATYRLCENCPGRQGEGSWDCLVSHILIGVK